MHLPKTLLLLTLLFLSYKSYSASFDCTIASTSIEKAICADENLSKMDEELSFFYTKLRKSLINNKDIANELLSQQRQWLRNRNRKCSPLPNITTCLTEQYQPRINALKSRYEKSFMPTFREIKAICTEITQISPSKRALYGDENSYQINQLNKSSYDFNNDGIKETAHRCYGGTMSAPCVEFKNQNGSLIQTQTIDFEWKDYWTFGLNAFKKNDKWYRLHSYDDQLKKPAYISFITPLNKEYIACEFSNKLNPIFKPNPHITNSQSVCDAVKNDTIVSLNFTTNSNNSNSRWKNIGRYETRLRSHAYLDYDNDGNQNSLVELIYSSGAGRGCDFNYFDELSDSEDSFRANPEESLLLKMQKVELNNRHPNCGSLINQKYSNRFFKFNSEVYYEHKTHKLREVLTINNGQIHSVCKVNNDYKTTVKNISKL